MTEKGKPNGLMEIEGVLNDGAFFREGE